MISSLSCLLDAGIVVLRFQIQPCTFLGYEGSRCRCSGRYSESHGAVIRPGICQRKLQVTEPMLVKEGLRRN